MPHCRRQQLIVPVKKCKDNLLRSLRQEALLLPVAVMQGVRAPENGFTARRIIGDSG